MVIPHSSADCQRAAGQERKGHEPSDRGQVTIMDLRVGVPGCTQRQLELKITKDSRCSRSHGTVTKEKAREKGDSLRRFQECGYYAQTNQPCLLYSMRPLRNSDYKNYHTVHVRKDLKVFQM